MHHIGAQSPAFLDRNTFSHIVQSDNFVTPLEIHGHLVFNREPDIEAVRHCPGILSGCRIPSSEHLLVEPPGKWSMNGHCLLKCSASDGVLTVHILDDLFRPVEAAHNTELAMSSGDRHLLVTESVQVWIKVCVHCGIANQLANRGMHRSVCIHAESFANGISHRQDIGHHHALFVSKDSSENLSA